MEICAGMFGALKPSFRSLAILKLVVNSSANFKPKRTAAASRGFLATARLSCCYCYRITDSSLVDVADAIVLVVLYMHKT